MTAQCVQVKLEIGHKAAIRKKPTQEGFTHDWSVFVRGPEGTDIQHFVEKVVFYLHDSFPKPKRSVKEPPYKIAESGYAGFVIPIEVCFRTKEEPKRVTFQYDLFLHIEGPPVNNIRCEKLTFQNPAEDFKEKLLRAGGVTVTRPDIPSSQQTSNDENTHQQNQPIARLPDLEPSVSDSNVQSISSKNDHDQSNKVCDTSSDAKQKIKTISSSSETSTSSKKYKTTGGKSLKEATKGSSKESSSQSSKVASNENQTSNTAKVASSKHIKAKQKPKKEYGKFNIDLFALKSPNVDGKVNSTSSVEEIGDKSAAVSSNSKSSVKKSSDDSKSASPQVNKHEKKKDKSKSSKSNDRKSEKIKNHEIRTEKKDKSDKVKSEKSKSDYVKSKEVKSANVKAEKVVKVANDEVKCSKDVKLSNGKSEDGKSVGIGKETKSAKLEKVKISDDKSIDAKIKTDHKMPKAKSEKMEKSKSESTEKLKSIDQKKEIKHAQKSLKTKTDARIQETTKSSSKVMESSSKSSKAKSTSVKAEKHESSKSKTEEPKEKKSKPSDVKLNVKNGEDKVKKLKLDESRKKNEVKSVKLTNDDHKSSKVKSDKRKMEVAQSLSASKKSKSQNDDNKKESVKSDTKLASKEKRKRKDSVEPSKKRKLSVHLESQINTDVDKMEVNGDCTSSRDTNMRSLIRSESKGFVMTSSEQATNNTKNHVSASNDDSLVAVKHHKNSKSRQHTDENNVVTSKPQSNYHQVKNGRSLNKDCIESNELKAESDVDSVYYSDLLDLQHKIMRTRERTMVQKIVDLIEKSGSYQICSQTFDFDLQSLDKETMKKLQIIVNNST